MMAPGRPWTRRARLRARFLRSRLSRAWCTVVGRHYPDTRLHPPALMVLWMDEVPELGRVLRLRPGLGPELERLVNAGDLPGPRRPWTPREMALMAAVAAEVRHRWAARRMELIRLSRKDVPLDDLLGTPGWNGDHHS
jgi:hypothetical protein